MEWDAVASSIGEIPCLFAPEQARVLWTLARGLSDTAAILEIGPFKGYTTAALAFACVGTQRHIWTIDTFTGMPQNTNEQGAPSYRAEFEANMKARGLTDYVTVLEGKSEEFYAAWDKPLELLFVDGCHYRPVVTADLTAFFPHLIAGGWLAMHDIYPPRYPFPQSDASRIAKVGLSIPAPMSGQGGMSALILPTGQELVLAASSTARRNAFLCPL